MKLGLIDFLDERFEVRRVTREFIDHQVPDHVNWLYCFGGITFSVF